MTNTLLLLFVSTKTTRLTAIDWVMIALYFGILAGVVAWVVRRMKDSTTDYFLAGRNLGWWIIGASIFASNIGSEHIVGLAGLGRHQRRGHGALRTACLVPAGSGVGLCAVLHALMVFTMPEFLERRFNEQSRYVLSIVSLITFVISKIARGNFRGRSGFCARCFPEM